MTLHLHNSASGKLERFSPLLEGHVGLYYCGATVQGPAHIGHMRSALVFDVLARWLRQCGYATTVVRNVTDIDDKILARAEADQEPWWKVALRFEREFDEAFARLNILPPDYVPRATGHMSEMWDLITRLIDGGHAYPAQDGSADVFFDVLSWPSYGALTRQSAEQMESAPDGGAGKRDPRDFALWKSVKPGEPESAAWNSPWGRGRPGWHLECSAMATKYLGGAFDIHGGGLDLRFPHHENEMAQSQAAGDPFARLWMHNGLVNMAGQKMSKSIGNVVTARDMFAQAAPSVVRYYLLSAHYRSVLDYSDTSLKEAEAAYNRLASFLDRSRNAVGDADESILPDEFVQAMNDDLSVPRALAVLHESVRRGNTALQSGETAGVLRRQAEVKAMMDVLGLILPEAGNKDDAAPLLDKLVGKMLENRAFARERKDFALSDALRDVLKDAGIEIEDGPEGPRWHVTGEEN